MSYVGDTGWLRGQVNDLAPQYGLDPAAVLAVAHVEGAGGGVGDGGTSFGPWQLHIGGALPDWVGHIGGSFAQQWAWSTEGVQYALQQMASHGASGLTGIDAINAIVRKFERPANPDAEVQNAIKAWGHSDTTTTTDTGTTPPNEGGTPLPPMAGGSGDGPCTPPTTEPTINAGPVPIPNPKYYTDQLGYYLCVLAYDAQRAAFMVVGVVVVILGIWLFSKDREAPDVVAVPVKQAEKTGKSITSITSAAAKAAAAGAAA